MSYLGRQPVLGNFVKLDAITVVNGQAAYTMQNGGVNFTDYTTVNQFLVSLNGTIQAATDSFTVSGSTITFASNLSTGDVIDFIIVFGNSLSAGTVSDSAITTAKLADSSVTTAKLNDASVSLAKLTATGTKDATTFLRGDNTFAAAGGGKVLQVVSNTAGYTQTNNSTFTTTNYSINITPSSASNKILISAYGTLDNQGTSGNRANATIFRDSTNIGDASNGLNSVYGSNARVIAPFAMVVLDSPNTTSQITYTVRYRAVAGTVSINDQGEIGQFIAMEIQA